MIQALNTAIYSKLGGTATTAGTAVFFEHAPDSQPLPYIVFDYVADIEDNNTPTEGINTVISARAYATTPTAAGTIDAKIKTLLHLATLTVTGYTNYWSARENGYSFVENQSGKNVYMAGADYRIRLTK